MPKNKGKGGKNRRRGKKEDEEKRELVFKEDGQEYGQVLRMLGNGRLEAWCFDGQKRLCHIRGKLRKKVWVNQGDIILLGLRDYQDGKSDVIMKYTADEARTLKAYGELPETAKINVDVEDNEDEGVQVDFEAASGESGSESEEEEEEDSSEDEDEEKPAAGKKVGFSKPAARGASKTAGDKADKAEKAPAPAAGKKPAAKSLYDDSEPAPAAKAKPAAPASSKPAPRSLYADLEEKPVVKAKPAAKSIYDNEEPLPPKGKAAAKGAAKPAAANGKPAPQTAAELKAASGKMANLAVRAN